MKNSPFLARIKCFDLQRYENYFTIKSTFEDSIFHRVFDCITFFGAAWFVLPQGTCSFHTALRALFVLMTQRILTLNSPYMILLLKNTLQQK